MELWHFNIDQFPNGKMEQAYSRLPENIRSEVERYHLLDDRKSRLIARLLIQKFMEENTQNWNWKNWKKSENGKPYLTDGPFFSISHAGKMVVVTFSNTNETGVDIERVTDVEVESLSAGFHVDEINYLQENNFDKDLFFRVWSRKEAFLKTIGIGLLEGLNQVSVLDNVMYEGEFIYLNDMKIENGYSCCTGVLMEQEKIEIKEITFNTINYFIDEKNLI